jgi:hypothetical protein
MPQRSLRGRVQCSCSLERDRIACRGPSIQTVHGRRARSGVEADTSGAVKCDELGVSVIRTLADRGDARAYPPSVREVAVLDPGAGRDRVGDGVPAVQGDPVGATLQGELILPYQPPREGHDVRIVASRRVSIANHDPVDPIGYWREAGPKGGRRSRCEEARAYGPLPVQEVSKSERRAARANRHVARSRGLNASLVPLNASLVPLNASLVPLNASLVPLNASLVPLIMLRSSCYRPAGGRRDARALDGRGRSCLRAGSGAEHGLVRRLQGHRRERVRSLTERPVRPGPDRIDLIVGGPYV